jgi:membrane associated rhomboid family serine protease
MFPLRDILPTRRPPYLTWALIAANILCFLYESSVIDAGYVHFVSDWGFVPARFLADPGADAVTLVTTMFLHGGWLHLLGNMWFLWIFGDNIEDRLGRLPFLAFYFGCGVVATAAQLLIDPGSTVPMIGASGAIAGVLGGYVMLYPSARVLSTIPPFFFLRFELPAWVVIGEWFLLQLSQGLSSLAAPGQGGVAFFAHIGGFLAGVLVVRRLAEHADPAEPDVWLPPGPRRPQGTSRYRR